jgi:hypothetical protein
MTLNTSYVLLQTSYEMRMVCSTEFRYLLSRRKFEAEIAKFPWIVVPNFRVTIHPGRNNSLLTLIVSSLRSNPHDEY